MATATPTRKIELPHEDFGVFTFNIKDFPDILTPEQIRACASIVGSQAGMGAFQEIADLSDDQNIEAVLKPGDWKHYHRDSENKLSVKVTRWEKASRRRCNGLDPVGRRKLSGGVAKVTPDRDVTWAAQDWKNKRDWRPVVLAGTHLVSGVDSNKSPHDVRVELRKEEFSGLEKFAAEVHAAKLPLILCLDSNWRKMPRIHPGFRWVINDGIDKIGVLDHPDAEYELTLVSAESYENPSDHPMRVANLRATSRAAVSVEPATHACPDCGLVHVIAR